MTDLISFCEPLAMSYVDDDAGDSAAFCAAFWLERMGGCMTGMCANVCTWTCPLLLACGQNR